MNHEATIYAIIAIMIVIIALGAVMSGCIK